jgi:hypothetical protein
MAMFETMNSSAAYIHSPRPIVPIKIVVTTPTPTNTASMRFLMAR